MALGILTSEEWRLTAWRSAPNTVRIVSPEWRTWLRMRDRKQAGVQDWRQVEEGGVRSSTTLRITDSFSLERVKRQRHGQEVGRAGGIRC